MKRILIIFALAMISMVCNAQIRYMGTTNNRQSTQTQQYQQSQQQYQQQYQEPQAQNFSTTAYYQTGNGYVKLPIRVTVQCGRVIPTMYYQQNVTGGQWCKFSGALTAQKCMSMSSDPLEKQFMYKCRIVNPAVTTIYFDL